MRGTWVAQSGELPTLFSSLFILRERVGEGQRERERERIPSRLPMVSTEPHLGLDLMNHEIMTSAEIKRWMLN